MPPKRAARVPRHAYSREGSRDFWRLVAALPEPERGELYLAGVLLQNMEETVLGWLYEAMRRHGHETPTPSKRRSSSKKGR